jgi:hypothetical protein
MALWPQIHNNEVIAKLLISSMVFGIQCHHDCWHGGDCCYLYIYTLRGGHCALCCIFGLAQTHELTTVLWVSTWVGSILVFYSEWKRGLKLINILPTHVETHNTVSPPWIISILITDMPTSPHSLTCICNWYSDE